MVQYMQMLIWMMLFVIIIEMIFPDSDYRKYLKLILGCILIYTLLKPVIALLPNNNYNYDEYVRLYQEKLGVGDSDMVSQYEEDVIEQKASLKAIYEESIKSAIENNVAVSVLSIDLSWGQGDDIEALYITVGEKDSASGILPIQIGNKSQTVNGDEEELKNKIKTCLNNFYNIQLRNIHITVQKK